MKPITVALPFTDGTYENYLSAVRAAGMEPVCIHSAEEDPGCDALLLPGGADINPSRYGEPLNGSEGIDDALDELQFAMLEKYVKSRKPVLGICRGHQLLNVFFGGTLYQHLDTADTHRIINGSEQFHRVDYTGDSPLSLLYGPGLNYNSSHHQGIKTPGKGLEVIAKAPDGTVEAVMHTDLPVIGVQWHPERMIGDALPNADGLKIFELLRKSAE